MNNKPVIYAIIAVVVIAIIVALVTTNKTEAPEVASNTEQTPTTQTNTTTVSEPNTPGFSNPKKSAHYESNAPAHGSVLAAPPVNVVIDFNFDLAAPSTISIKKDGKEYGLGETTIDSNKLSLRRAFDTTAPDGTYKVSYNACWPDKTCHEGYFEFAIDRTLAADYENMQSKKEVIVKMSQIIFTPRNIIISAGTKVTWVNDDTVEHYVNTDSHPAHTYHLSQNSRSLTKGASYSTTFDKAGFYPYHCSAHASTMVGNIIVI